MQNSPSIRLFCTHEVRPVYSLDGLWTLHLPQQGTKIAAMDWTSGVEYRYRVPGVWETLPDLVNYRGEAVARRTFSTPTTGPARLVFAGISHTAHVFIDGVEVAYHEGAFTPFAVDLPEVGSGKHELLIHISNEHGEISALHIPNDYYNYGGISRPVELQVPKSRLHIRYAHFTPRRMDDGSWQARLKISLQNHGPATEARLTAKIADEVHEFGAVQMEKGESFQTCAMKFHDVEPWSSTHPRLYDIVVTLADENGPLDDWRDRTGFREVRVDGEKILLNGEPVFIVGFNRHEDHPHYGNALPVEAMEHDVRLMRDMGANAVRTSHYPNDQRFLDLCDETGLMVWEENHARGLKLEQMQHPRFRDQCRVCNAEMIQWHYNHPSILMWGILNECSSFTEEGLAMYAEQFEQIRLLDSSRPTTFASCHPTKDICQDLPDIIGWNFYDSWYRNDGAAAGLEEHLTYIDPNGGAGKPMIISEFGGGALPGYHDPIRRGKWSEERQSDILDECLTVYLMHPRISGVFIWQFCDVRVDESFSTARPRTMNNKGIVDEFRRPKLSYAVVQKHFRNLTKKHKAMDS